MKFDRLRTRVLYGRTPVDEEVGSCTEGLGWAGLYMRWENKGGFILEEDTEGFVTGQEYRTDEAIEAAWIQACDRLEISGSPDHEDPVIMENMKTGEYHCLYTGDGVMYEELEDLIEELVRNPSTEGRNYWFLNERGNFIPLSADRYLK